ncbi:MAG: hypothetical protein RLZZ360_935 [Candidatus Parcubacteria bacterium]|jgi:predicted GH43/DUF377 family glycosyl hydrolase
MTLTINSDRVLINHAGHVCAMSEEITKAISCYSKIATATITRKDLCGNEVPRIPRRGTLYVVTYTNRDGSKVRLPEQLFFRIEKSVLHVHKVPKVKSHTPAPHR